MPKISEGIVQAIVGAESFPERFERFVNDVVGELEGGIQVLSTSRSYDIGRDGRAEGQGKGLFTCCSLTDDVDDKAESDVNKLVASTIGIRRIYFCSSQPLSEYRCAAIERNLRRLLPEGATIIVLGRDHLAQYGARAPQLVQAHYRAEYDDAVRVLAGEQADEDSATHGLRLALVTVGCSDSTQIRSALYRSSLLSVLTDGAPRNVNECARDVSAWLRLARSLPGEIVEPNLRALEAEGVVVRHDGRYRISEAGCNAITATRQAAAENLLAGRQKVRDQFERATGQRIAEDHFQQIWAAFEEKIAVLFYNRGQEMLEFVASLVADEEGGREIDAGKRPSSVLDEVADSVAATSSNRDQQAELRTAVHDLFVDQNGPAAEWLVGVCAGYVGLCSLGLEATSGDALAKVLARMQLVFDTDILLSLLNSGEPDHEAVLSITKRWRRLGGKLLLAHPVLHEVAYHAWIAEHDYREVQRWLPGSEDDRLRLIENAFVRGFADQVARGKARKGHWRHYVRQYLGKTSSDVSRVAGLLQEEYKMQSLLPMSAAERDLNQRVRSRLIDLVHARMRGRQVRNAVDKAKRDAELYAAMVRQIRALQAEGRGASCLLVSSARRLVRIEAEFAQVGDPHFVVSLGMVVYLLSLIPEVKVGLAAMKSFLFDAPRQTFSGELERVLLRVVRESRDLDVPFGKRSTLMREVRERLLEDARKSGAPARTDAQRAEVERQATLSRNQPRTIEILRDSLNAIAAEGKEERENRELRRRVEELEALVRSLQKGSVLAGGTTSKGRR